MDVVGRLKQVDELNWNQTVYSGTTYTYNVRDQLTGINQAGQTRTFTYDGHGRLQTRTTPEQGRHELQLFRRRHSPDHYRCSRSNDDLQLQPAALVTGISYGVTGTKRRRHRTSALVMTPPAIARR